MKSKDDLLKHFLFRNENGVWAVWCDEDKYHVLPRWIWGFLDKILGKKH